MASTTALFPEMIAGAAVELTPSKGTSVLKPQTHTLSPGRFLYPAKTAFKISCRYRINSLLFTSRVALVFILAKARMLSSLKLVVLAVTTLGALSAIALGQYPTNDPSKTLVVFSCERPVSTGLKSTHSMPVCADAKAIADPNAKTIRIEDANFAQDPNNKSRWGYNCDKKAPLVAHRCCRPEVQFKHISQSDVNKDEFNKNCIGYLPPPPKVKRSKTYHGL